MSAQLCALGEYAVYFGNLLRAPFGRVRMVFHGGEIAAEKQLVVNGIITFILARKFQTRRQREIGDNIPLFDDLFAVKRFGCHSDIIQIVRCNSVFQINAFCFRIRRQIKQICENKYIFFIVSQKNRLVLGIPNQKKTPSAYCYLYYKNNIRPPC